MCIHLSRDYTWPGRPRHSGAVTHHPLAGVETNIRIELKVMMGTCALLDLTLLTGG
jgi:hypothetical protein